MQVEAGEVFGFIGPNGAGKSTTIKLLMGLIFPRRGARESWANRSPTWKCTETLVTFPSSPTSTTTLLQRKYSIILRGFTT